MERYDPQAIEAKWQRIWEDVRAFYTPNPAPGEESEGHWYQLEMLPYPSGTLHMGHVLNYTLGDVLTHYHRRLGWTVLRPMGGTRSDYRPRTLRSARAVTRATSSSGTSSRSGNR